MKRDIPKQKDNLTARLAGYATTAGAMMALAPAVKGQVIYSGVQNLQLDMPADSLELDLNNDTITDFNFKIYGTSSSFMTNGHTYGYAFGYAVIFNPKTDTYKNSWITRMTSLLSITFSYTNGTTYTNYTYYPYPIVDGLSASDMVGSSRTMWSNLSYPGIPGALGFGYIYSTYGPTYNGFYAYGYGDFFSHSAYVGVRFYIGTDVHYGWIRVSLGDYIDPLTIIDWAYESTPDTPIHVGDLGGIEPPVATLTTGITSTEDQTITVQVSFDKEVSGLEIGDFNVINGIAANLVEVTPGTDFTVEVTAIDEGMVYMNLPAGSVVDDMNVGNELVSTSWEYIMINALGSNSFSYNIFPNPVDNLLTVELVSIADITLFNTAGKVMLQKNEVLNEVLDVSQFAPGVYILQIKADGEIIRDKILIK